LPEERGLYQKMKVGDELLFLAALLHGLAPSLIDSATGVKQLSLYVVLWIVTPLAPPPPMR